MDYLGIKKKYLVNCSNLHVGGGVQVATSFISELSKLESFPDNIFLWVSSQVDLNLKTLNVDFSRFNNNYEVVDVFGLSSLFAKGCRRFSEFDRVFTIFGPLYTFERNFYSIVGFAQPWIVYPSNEVYSMLSFWDKIKYKFKFFVQKQFFKKSDMLVVELEHVAKALFSHVIGNESNVKVVHNCVSSIYFDKSLWKEFDFKALGSGIKIGFLGRNYNHKNTNILPVVKSLLLEKYNLVIDFYVTFTEDEWSKCSCEFKSNIFNVGSLSVAQCPIFYEAMDGIIFPSLLECFSATPLETMIMERPLFASDREFNRDICSNYAIYFEPLSSISIAESIAKYFLDEAYRSSFGLQEAKMHALNFSNAKLRAEHYLGLVSGNI